VSFLSLEHSRNVNGMHQTNKQPICSRRPSLPGSKGHSHVVRGLPHTLQA